MRRLALLVAVIATGIASALAAESGTPPGTKFIGKDDPYEFSFPSTKGWDVEGPGKERVVQVARAPDPSASDPLERQGLAYLWAKECSRKRQTVHFVREVFLAGPEDSLAATVGLLYADGSTFKSVKVLVNGLRVLKVGPGGGGLDLTRDRPRVFRFGNNRLEVVAVKKASASGRPCNRSQEPGRITGVAFSVSGYLAGDVSLPAQTPEEYRRLDEGVFGVRIPLDFEVRNNGPGGLSRVPLNVVVEVPVTGEPHGTHLEVSEPQTPVQSCAATPPVGYAPDGPREVHCTIANLRTGATARQSMRFSFLLPSGEERVPVSIRWSTDADEPPGASQTDNQRQKTIWICKHDAQSCPAG